jgi:type II secretory pathway pseudopilin PulG
VIGEVKHKASSVKRGEGSIDLRATFYASRLTLNDSGYTLVGIVMMIAVLTILIAAVGPAVSTIMKRDREEELIFRGRQYARAITLFQRRFGRYPNTLKELYENRPRSIRKLWKDPMCGCDDWKVLILGQPDAAPYAERQANPNAPPSTYTGVVRPTPAPASPFGGGEEAEPVGPIVGVRSKIHQQSLREWRGKRFYDEWRFIVGDADAPADFDPTNLGPTPRAVTPSRK